MKSIRDWQWTRESEFYDEPEVEEWAFGIFFGALAGILFGFVIGAAVDMFGAATSKGVITSIVVFVLFAFHMVWVPRFNRYHRIESKGMRRLGYRYRELPKKDRAEFFPANFERVLRQSNDMDAVQRRKIEHEALRTFDEITRRNEVVKAAEASARASMVDIQDFVDDLARGRQYAQIQRETYEEFM